MSSSLPELAVLHGACARLHGNDAKLYSASGGTGGRSRRLYDRHKPLTEALVAPSVVTLRSVLAVCLSYALAGLLAQHVL